VKYAAGDSDWTATSPAPNSELRAPALVWTGREILARGGEGEDQSPRLVGGKTSPQPVVI
jgi:hypothetical protein